MVFSPLLDRFYSGQDYRSRAVKISDSGRIRNELQTLASEAIEYAADDRMRVHFEQVDDAVLPPDKKRLIQRRAALVQGQPPDLVLVAGPRVRHTLRVRRSCPLGHCVSTGSVSWARRARRSSGTREGRRSPGRTWAINVTASAASSPLASTRYSKQ